MKTNLNLVLLTRLSVFIALASTGLAVNSWIQKKALHKPEIIKLEYSSPDLRTADEKYTPRAISPIDVSADRLLVPVGDVLYMLDSNNQVVWEYVLEPDIIQDVMVDSKGDSYVTVSDGLLLALNAAGKEVWRTGMMGSANYGQIKSYETGFLVIVNMQGYREKGSDSEDILQFWKDRKLAWEKPFPREAKLQVWANKILAVKPIKEGQEIQEIR
jgi:hypothetical protein